jgi:hypothetical protein
MDEDWLKKPRPWGIGSIARFMILIGPISSIFDITTFLGMWYIFGAKSLGTQSLFQTAWFVESLLTQTLIVHMIRTEKIPFIQSTASMPVVLLASAIMIIGCLVPFSPLSKAAGMVHLPLGYWPFLAITLLAYCLVTQFCNEAAPSPSASRYDRELARAAAAYIANTDRKCQSQPASARCLQADQDHRLHLGRRGTRMGCRQAGGDAESRVPRRDVRGRSVARNLSGDPQGTLQLFLIDLRTLLAAVECRRGALAPHTNGPQVGLKALKRSARSWLQDETNMVLQAISDALVISVCGPVDARQRQNNRHAAGAHFSGSHLCKRLRITAFCVR